MKQRNPFKGTGSYARYAKAIYEFMIARKWFGYEDVVKKAYLKAYDPKKEPISKIDDYGELKKAFSDIKKLICQRQGADSIEEKGSTRNKRIRYVGHDNDPLEDMQNAKTVDELRAYFEFCQASTGFMPEAWLDYFFDDRERLLSKNRQQIIGTDMALRPLENVDLLPRLYEAIKKREVLRIKYKPYSLPLQTYIVSPHYLKEYNGRWFLFCHSDELRQYEAAHLALDRMQELQPVSGYEYLPAQEGFYQAYFKDKVGVTHTKGAQPTDIVIRAYDENMFKLVKTKPIHQSQQIVAPFNGTYGDFTVHVEVNNEFLGRILQMGDKLEIVAPDTVRRDMAQRVRNMAQRYEQHT